MVWIHLLPLFLLSSPPALLLPCAAHIVVTTRNEERKGVPSSVFEGMAWKTVSEVSGQLRELTELGNEGVLREPGWAAGMDDGIEGMLDTLRRCVHVCHIPTGVIFQLASYPNMCHIPAGVIFQLAPYPNMCHISTSYVKARHFPIGGIPQCMAYLIRCVTFQCASSSKIGHYHDVYHISLRAVD